MLSLKSAAATIMNHVEWGKHSYSIFEHSVFFSFNSIALKLLYAACCFFSGVAFDHDNDEGQDGPIENAYEAVNEHKEAQPANESIDSGDAFSQFDRNLEDNESSTETWNSTFDRSSAIEEEIVVVEAVELHRGTSDDDGDSFDSFSSK